MHSTTGAGALGGGFWGLLSGLIFFVPLLGLAVGAGMGTNTGSMRDVGIRDGFITPLQCGEAGCGHEETAGGLTSPGA